MSRRWWTQKPRWTKTPRKLRQQGRGGPHGNGSLVILTDSHRPSGRTGPFLPRGGCGSSVPPEDKTPEGGVPPPILWESIALSNLGPTPSTNTTRTPRSGGLWRTLTPRWLAQAPGWPSKGASPSLQPSRPPAGLAPKAHGPAWRPPGTSPPVQTRLGQQLSRALEGHHTLPFWGSVHTAPRTPRGCPQPRGPAGIPLRPTPLHGGGGGWRGSTGADGPTCGTHYRSGRPGASPPLGPRGNITARGHRIPGSGPSGGVPGHGNPLG